jgi:prophage maintenance system killer protein
MNKIVCEAEGHPHHVLNSDRIESALHSAFYPGTPPFAFGGIAKLAGAMCFYLTKGHAFQDGNKRTAALAAISFMNLHGWDLVYPLDGETIDAMADIVESVAAGTCGRDEMIEWFELHKRLVSDEEDSE